jgi:spore germination protein YaaH
MRRAHIVLLAGAAAVAVPAGAGASISGLAAIVSSSGGTLARVGERAAPPRNQIHASAVCAGRTVADIRLRRLSSGMRARLSWRAPRGGAGSATPIFRVLRSGRTVGQTAEDSMVLAVSPGVRTTFTVQARYEAPARSCAAQLVMRVPVRLATRVRGLSVQKRSSTGVVIAWRAARAGDAPIAGYRVSLDGAVAGDTRSRHYTLILNLARTHRVRVAAVDTRGRLGAQSAQLLVGANARALGAPPSTPEGLSASDLSATEATVWWLPSRAGAARLAGYRVYREGRLVGETSTTSMHLTHLASLHTYAITVSALDADGAESARSAPLKLATAHLAPSAPSMLAASRVSDTSATLSWQAGSAASGNVAGYLLFEDGQPVGLIQGQVVTVALASERTYVFTVRTMDSAGYLSAPAPEVSVTTTHTPPPAPAHVSAVAIGSTSATITWAASTPVSGTIVGYRVFRDEIPVAQTAAIDLTIESLAPSSEYTITVSAVDSLGAVSEPSAPLELRTTEPPPTHGSVQAYLLASTDESFEDLQAHYQQIGVLYPTYYECGPQGTVTGSNDALITNWALARKIEVLPRVNCLNVRYEEELLGSPSGPRERLIEGLAALCREDGYTGIQIDFENAPPFYRNLFTLFITQLAARLHGQGSKLSTVVTSKYYNILSGRAAMYDDAALSVPSDYMFVLDWGLHWVTSAPGSIDEYEWFKRVAEYTATLPNLDKYTLGMPLYGVDWPGEGGKEHPGTAMEYSAIVELAGQLGVTPAWEAAAQSPHFSYTDSSGVGHQVWYVDEQSLAPRAQLASSLGLNIGLWRLGREDQRIWELPQLGAGA